MSKHRRNFALIELLGIARSNSNIQNLTLVTRNSTLGISGISRSESQARNFTLPQFCHRVAWRASSPTQGWRVMSMVSDGDDDFFAGMEDINTTDLIDSDFADAAGEDQALGVCVAVPTAGHATSSSKDEATQCSCLCCGDVVFVATWF